MKKYFLHNETEQLGPFDTEDLREKKITKETPIWYEGLSDWTTAEKVDELKELFISETPPIFKISRTPPPFKIPLIHRNVDITPSRKRNKFLIYSFVGIGLMLLVGGGFFLYQYSLKKVEINIQKAKDDAIKQERENAILQQQTDEEHKKQQIENQKYKIRNNWNDYIKVERNSYTYKEIGGISDLYITVTNKTDYTLDNVTAKISYIKENGTIYKTETISFNGIAPHYQLKKKAPDSDRGTSVDFLQITSISSKGLNFCYEEGNWAKNSNDPYKCE